ncbi:MAG: GntR family transcriptional regulator [Tepidisphaeraceae bacterium]
MSRTPASPAAPTEHRYEGVVAHIRQLIEAGTLRVGDRLPSVRQLATRQRLAVGTVLHA